MKKINKFIGSFVLIGLFLFVSASFVSAATTGIMVADNVSLCIGTNCGNILNGDSLIQASYNAAYEDQNWSSANIYIQSTSLTANNSLSILNASGGYVMNTTTANNISITALSSKVEDGNDYTITINLFNGSDFVNKTASSIVVDTTIPNTPTSLTPTSDSDGDVTFSCSVEGRNTTSCTLFFSEGNPGKLSYSMTHTGDTCTYSLSGMPEQTYKYFIQASDESNRTNSSIQTINVDITTSAGKAAKLIEEKGVTSKGGALLSIAQNGLGSSGVWIVVIVVGIFVVYFVVKKK